MSEIITDQEHKHKRIRLLSPDVAAKIAAGEVIERPASVLKELLENSIDSGATRIEVEVREGGSHYIRVTDNGVGILKADLQLALQQHATSKINAAEDLASINSLGFRGEALASIHSVAKLSITSQTKNSDHAWNISGSTISAAAHPMGTTVTVTDLFYNLPARRKFLRSPRTEYLYLEELFRRVALSHFGISFSLMHQGKLVKKLPSCIDTVHQRKRVATLCGAQIVDSSIHIDCEQNGMRLHGWLGNVEMARSQETHQYFFINQRVIKDRLINHALREVYQPLCEEGKAPFYCLYLQLDPEGLDVNVHPTKHEVRFRDARIVHAFIVQALSDALGQSSRAITEIDNGPTRDALTLPMPSFKNHPMQVLGILQNKIILGQCNEDLVFIDIVLAQKCELRRKLQVGKPVQLPSPFTLACTHAIDMEGAFVTWCEQFGIYIDVLSPHKVAVRKLVADLHSMDFDGPALLQNLYAAWKAQTAQDACWDIIINAVRFRPITSLRHAQDLVSCIDLANPEVCKQFSVAELQARLFKN